MAQKREIVEVELPEGLLEQAIALGIDVEAACDKALERAIEEVKNGGSK